VVVVVVVVSCTHDTHFREFLYPWSTFSRISVPRVHISNLSTESAAASAWTLRKALWRWESSLHYNWNKDLHNVVVLSASIVFSSRPPSRLSMHYIHSLGPLAAAHALAQKVTHVLLLLGFNCFQPVFFCPRHGEWFSSVQRLQFLWMRVLLCELSRWCFTICCRMLRCSAKSLGFVFLISSFFIAISR
jgi:hypothetical protein